MLPNLGKDDTLHPFLFTLHDWIAYLIKDTYWWNTYDTSIKDVILKKLQPMSSPVLTWADASISAPLTSYTLLYRHYLCRYLLDEEIYPDHHSSIVYGIMAVTMSEPIVFSPVPYDPLWIECDTDPNPINVLRHKRDAIRKYIDRLAMRDDETPMRLIRDHGLLSSVNLLYGLQLVRVILVYETSVRPDDDLMHILQSVSNTLTQIKGVMNHVQSDWLGVDVW